MNFLDQLDSLVFLLLSVLIYCFVLNYSNDIAMCFWTYRIIDLINIFCYLYESLMHSVLCILLIM